MTKLIDVHISHVVKFPHWTDFFHIYHVEIFFHMTCGDFHHMTICHVANMRYVRRQGATFLKHIYLYELSVISFSFVTSQKTNGMFSKPKVIGCHHHAKLTSNIAHTEYITFSFSLSMRRFCWCLLDWVTRL